MKIDTTLQQKCIGLSSYAAEYRIPNQKIFFLKKGDVLSAIQYQLGTKAAESISIGPLPTVESGDASPLSPKKTICRLLSNGFIPRIEEKQLFFYRERDPSGPGPSTSATQIDQFKNFKTVLEKSIQSYRSLLPVGSESIPYFYRDAVDENEKKAQICLKTAEDFSDEQDWDEALEMFEKGLKFTSQSEYYAWLPPLYEKKGESKKAVLAYLYLARKELEENKSSLIEATLEKAYALIPDHYDVRAALASFYQAIGKEEKAFELLMKDVSSLLEKGEKKTAIAYLEQALANKPNHYALYAQLEKLYDEDEKKLHMLIMGILNAGRSNKNQAQTFYHQAQLLELNTDEHHLAYLSILDKHSDQIQRQELLRTLANFYKGKEDLPNYIACLQKLLFWHHEEDFRALTQAFSNCKGAIPKPAYYQFVQEQSQRLEKVEKASQVAEEPVRPESSKVTYSLVNIYAKIPEFIFYDGKTVRAEKDPFSHIKFRRFSKSPDKRFSIEHDPHHISIYEVASGHLLQSLRCEEGFTCLGWMQNGWLVTGLENGAIKLWDPENGICLHTIADLKVQGARIQSISELDNGILVSSHYFGNLKWCAAVWAPLTQLSKPKTSALSTLVQSSKKTFLSQTHVIDFKTACAISSDAKPHRIVPLLDGSFIIEIGTGFPGLNNPGFKYGSNTFSNVIMWNRKTQTIIDLGKTYRTGMPITVLKNGHIAIAFRRHPDPERMGYSPIEIYDRQGKILHSMDSNALYHTRFLELSDGTLATIGVYPDTSIGYSELKIWNVESGTCLRVFARSKLFPSSVKGHIVVFKELPNKKLMVGFSSQDAVIIDLKQSNPLQTINYLAPLGTSSFVSPHLREIKGFSLGEGLIGTSSRKKYTLLDHQTNTLDIYDSSKGVCLGSLMRPPTPKQIGNFIYVGAVPLKDGKVALHSEDSGSQEVEIWDLKKRKCLLCFQIGFGKAGRGGVKLTALKNGVLVSQEGNAAIHLWDSTTGGCLQKIRPKTKDVSITNYTELTDGSLAVLASNGIVTLWKI